MEIAFVRTENHQDRVYVRRTDGTEVSWSFPTYGNYIPHDLVHLVAETAFGLKNGFWGRVDAGIDIARINEIANRKGGPNKYAAFGPDGFELLTAEFLAGTHWSDATLSDEQIAADLVRSFPHLAPITAAKVATVRSAINRLCAIWTSLLPKGALRARFDTNDLEGSFSSIGTNS
jgi:hypothetical protein